MDPRRGSVREGPTGSRSGVELEVQIPAGSVVLNGNLLLPAEALGCVIFVHGSGSSRFSPRNRYVAQALRGRGLANLLLDLLTPEEEAEDLVTANRRFDLELLTSRLVHTLVWVQSNPRIASLSLGLFGGSTGAAAALMTAAHNPWMVRAIVSRGGRPDLAWDALPLVRAPTLLIVGGNDRLVLELNRRAHGHLGALAELAVVPGATHLFVEAGALERVAELGGDWFVRYLTGRPARELAAQL